MIRSGKFASHAVIVILCLAAAYPASAPAQPAAIHQDAVRRAVRAGAAYLNAGNYQAARESFEQAVNADDAEAEAHLGLGVACFQLHDDNTAEQELNRAVVLNPRDATAYQVLGELRYRRDDFESAVTLWEKALKLNPSNTALRTRLEHVRSEHRVEKDFNRDVTSHFLIKYEGREKIEAGKIVLRILEDAYGTVGRALAYYPDRAIQVILYSEQQFQEVTDAPGWSGGLFDGKIRIPIGGIEQETPGLRRTLNHEYTHAVVRAITPRCPTWLNEGLAQYFEGKEPDGRAGEALKGIALSGKLPRLVTLEGSFAGLSGNQARYAYLFSLSAVRYLIDSFGMYRVKTILEELAAGKDTGSAIGNGILISYEDFERGWKRSLE